MGKWELIQENAIQILSDGMHELLRQPYKRLDLQIEGMPGNYLISLNKKGLYVGESLDVSHRLKQQANLRVSTFYKNYLRGKPTVPKAISDFRVQVIQTNLGRKELEEFCIVNVPTPLNKFQLDKKTKLVLEDTGVWSNVQSDFRFILDEGIQEILSLPKRGLTLLDIPDKGGVYLIYHGNELIYVGETSCLSERIETHFSRTYFSAFRRNCGTVLLGFTLKTKNNKKRYFSDEEEIELNRFLKECFVVPYPVAIGRGELEECLINRFSPILNKKGNDVD